MSTNNPVCDTGCDVKMPVFSFSDCDPEIHRGQIDKIYLASLGAASFVDWTQLAEWTTRISNTDTLSLDTIRELNVIAEKPEAAGDEIEISLNRKIILDKTHTINIDIDELTDDNYDALRQYECGGNVKFWYGVDTLLFGGNDGVEGYLKANIMIPKGRKELILIKATLTWEAKFHPEMCVNPMV